MTPPSKYILTFTVRFEYSSDKAYFAYCFPYTFTDMQRHLSSLMTSPTPNCVIQREAVRCAVGPCRGVAFRHDLALAVLRLQLCTTLAGNQCDLLTIHDGQQPGTPPIPRRKVVVLSARVHPGESNASWIMEGLLDFLTGTSDEALWLRSRYVFKVVPMLNPDGVINGNYRTSYVVCLC